MSVIRYLIPIGILFLLWNCPLQGQDSTVTFPQNFIGAKVLFVDYGNPNDIDSLSTTNGLEVYYFRNINSYLRIGVPLKAGVANIAGELNNRTFTSADLVLRGQYYQPTARVVPYAFAGIGYVWELEGEPNTQVPLGLGLDVRVGQGSYLNLQGEYRISELELRDNLQIGLGFTYRINLSLKDSDDDGVLDSSDACPNVAGLKTLQGCPDSDRDGIRDTEDRCPNAAGPVDQQGCPDSDSDGVLDLEDDCPQEAGTLNGCPDLDEDGVADKDDACPETPGIAARDGCPDSDGDGLRDSQDECPEEAGDIARNGCPVRDRDGDGVPDEEDACPDAAGDIDGCPDTDGDGIVDPEDACPAEAGTLDGCPDFDDDGVADKDDACPQQVGTIANKGCPEIAEEDRETLQFAMQAVQFQSGSARLKPESNEVLDQIVQIMERYPDYKLRIEGHTDSQGAEQTNQVLSEERAKACFQYLAANGVRPDRMRYKGFGESQPIADNTTATGRGLNRRVAFELYLD